MRRHLDAESGGDRTKHDLNEAIAQVGKALGHPGRVELLDLLSQAERGVARLVQTRREGTRVIYRLADRDVADLLNQTRRVARSRAAGVDALLDAFHRDADALDSIGPEELAERIASGEVVVIDVRPAEEYAAGHISGARSIPLPELRDRLAELPPGREVVAYCRGPFCLLAPEAVGVLRAAGRPARRLELGVTEWRDTGRPVSAAA
jgi:rhodanese-related sulfurtransferase/DNA-binding transcriptional ArsR family regulator